MSVPANTVQTDDVSASNREDIVEAIYNIDPWETPFLSMAQRVKATATNHEWVTDTLSAAATNIQIEGDDATAIATTTPAKLNNYTQISDKVVSVSRTQRSIDSVGRADELAYQISKEGKSLKLDMEYALVREQASSAGGAATARASAGLECWLATNRTLSTGDTTGTTPGHSGTTVASPTDGTQAALTKANLDTTIQNIWTAGGNPTEIMCGPFNRGAISGFTGISQLQTPASPDAAVTMIGAIDFYKSNFGTLRIQPSRVMRDRTVLILDMDYLAVAFIDDMVMHDLAKTGDSDKYQMVSEFCLEVRNEAACGKVQDVTTS